MPAAGGQGAAAALALPAAEEGLQQRAHAAAGQAQQAATAGRAKTQRMICRVRLVAMSQCAAAQLRMPAFLPAVGALLGCLPTCLPGAKAPNRRNLGICMDDLDTKRLVRAAEWVSHATRLPPYFDILMQTLTMWTPRACGAWWRTCDGAAGACRHVCLELLIAQCSQVEGMRRGWRMQARGLPSAPQMQLPHICLHQ